uniref:Uncharacterized protein n=1 Tax=Cannabis sativa TaxID=3483 RepID=A0A803PYE5_CANSA
MVNTYWMNAFPCSNVVFLRELSFDHSHILVSIYEDRSSGRKPFRYYNMWKMAPDYDALVAESCKEDSRGSKMYIILQKLRRLKNMLNQINKIGFSEIHKTEVTVRAELAELQSKLSQEPQNKKLMEQEQVVRKKCTGINKAFASSMSQKSKVSWVKFGYENSHIFHASLKSRRIQNRIFLIEDEHGNWCDTPNQIQHAFLEYYQKLLGSTTPGRRKVHQSVVDLGPKINDYHKEILLTDYTTKEVEEAMFSIDGIKHLVLMVMEVLFFIG